MKFERLIVLRNPVSTDAHRAARRIRDLQQQQPDAELIILDTRRRGREANAALLRQHSNKLGEHSLLCIAGGDGTINMVLDILLREPSLSEAARRTPILPLWGGNANDLAFMLNGPPTRGTFKALFAKGKVVAVHPLLCTLERKGIVKTHLAACYASFGASGFAMQELERTIRSRSPMRQPAVTRFGQELVEVSRLLLRAPTFTVSESNKDKVIFERVFLNGSRFAKIAAVPLKLTDQRFHRTTAEHKSIFTLLFRIAELVRDRAGRRMAATYDHFTIRDRVWAQFDGEVLSIPANTEVTITVAEVPFYALTTRFSK